MEELLRAVHEPEHVSRFGVNAASWSHWLINRAENELQHYSWARTFKRDENLRELKPDIAREYRSALDRLANELPPQDFIRSVIDTGAMVNVESPVKSAASRPLRKTKLSHSAPVLTDAELARIRQAIRKAGKKATAKRILKHVDLKRQKVYFALRVLESRGEYSGFTRKPTPQMQARVERFNRAAQSSVPESSGN